MLGCLYLMFSKLVHSVNQLSHYMYVCVCCTCIGGHRYWRCPQFTVVPEKVCLLLRSDTSTNTIATCDWLHSINSLSLFLFPSHLSLSLPSSLPPSLPPLLSPFLPPFLPFSLSPSLPPTHVCIQVIRHSMQIPGDMFDDDSRSWTSSVWGTQHHHHC